MQVLGRRILQFRFLFGQNCPLHRTNLQANAAVDAGIKINPVPVSAFGIFTRPFVNTSDGTSVDAISDAFANIGNDGVSHGITEDIVYKS